MMRFRLLFFISVMVLCTTPCYAQYQYEEYYKVDDNTYVTTVPDAELYELSQEEYNRMKNKPRNSQMSRDYVNLYGCKTKKIKKPVQLKVVRFTNTVKQPGFNAYVVIYKEKLWVINRNGVQDNTCIDERNAKIVKAKQDLNIEQQKWVEKRLALNKEKGKIDEEINREIARYQKSYTDSLNYYRSLKERLPKMRDSLVAVAEAQALANAEKERKAWYNSLPASTKKAANLISITEFGLSEPNFVGGCDYTLCYINKSKKTIKYLYWTGTVYNRVNDLAYCEIRRTATYKGVDTGPFAPEEEGGGYWENVVYNHAADTLKLNSISITYMDGSSATIAAADIRRLINEPCYETGINEYAVRKLVMSDEECRNRIRLWQSNLDKLTKDGYSVLSAQNKQYCELESQLNEVEIEIKKIGAQVDRIDAFNSFRSVFQVQGVGYQFGGNTYSSNLTNTYNKENPFVTFGIEGSLEGLRSVSTGWGVSLRVGRFNSLFNATIGAKYQYTGYSRWVSYFFQDYYGSGYLDYEWCDGDADYKHKAHQIVIPVVVNCNVGRFDYCSYYMGVGYEHGFLLSQTYEFNNPSYGFNKYDFYRSDAVDTIVTLSVPSRTVLFQMGLAGRHWDWKVYYKFYANNKKYFNGDKGSLGTAFTYYF